MLNNVPLERMMFSLSSGGMTIDAVESSVSVQDMPGRDGRLDLTLTDPTGAAYMGNRDITLNLYSIGTEDDILAAKQRLTALSGTMVTLSWRGLPGHYRGRLGLGAWNDKWAGGHLVATLVTITVNAYPYLIGRKLSITLQPGVNTIRVKGNRPCWPIWTLTPASGAKTVDAQDAHGHKLTFTSVTAITGDITIETDPDSRELRVNGNLMTPTLDSDYFPLLPGANTLTLAGIASASVAYQPLTLI
ncbi:phage distal tail protein [Bifidobacterium miconis]|nr:3-hydroxy-3-methylglutaryl CoA synthase [Bifidobacterium miconis]